MQTQNRAAPHFLLGSLTVLSVGAILFSLSKAPPAAQSELRTAASDTAGASSFVLTDVESVGPAGAPVGSGQRVQAVLVYDAPDKVRETVSGGGHNQTALVLGPARYERLSTGKWVSLGASGPGASSAGARAAADILAPFQSMAAATDVTKGTGGVFGFTPPDEQLLLVRLLGSRLAGAPGTTTWQGTVTGEYVSDVRLSLFGSGERLTVDLALTGIGHAPALEAPPPGG